MLLTLPVAGTILLARCDFGHNGEAIDGKCSKFSRSALLHSGITVTKDVQLTSAILLVSAVSYLFIQIVAFVYMNSPDLVAVEHPWALAGTICAFVGRRALTAGR